MNLTFVQGIPGFGRAHISLSGPAVIVIGAAATAAAAVNAAALIQFHSDMREQSHSDTGEVSSGSTSRAPAAGDRYGTTAHGRWVAGGFRSSTWSR